MTATRLYRRSPLYVMSYQGHWEEQVYQTELPLWTRVYALAMARSEPNLHTRIGEAELAVLGKPGQTEPAIPLTVDAFGKRSSD